mmetsp:Transcript_4015/g.5858  ORF Transcript_4015/g.5858 Transcript_4015/m.5858 type:complete len:294 (+) Transcript_4015:1986-2867(+)
MTTPKTILSRGCSSCSSRSANISISYVTTTNAPRIFAKSATSVNGDKFLICLKRTSSDSPGIHIAITSLSERDCFKLLKFSPIKIKYATQNAVCVITNKISTISEPFSPPIANPISPYPRTCLPCPSKRLLQSTNIIIVYVDKNPTTGRTIREPSTPVFINANGRPSTPAPINDINICAAVDKSELPPTSSEVLGVITRGMSLVSMYSSSSTTPRFDVFSTGPSSKVSRLSAFSPLSRDRLLIIHNILQYSAQGATETNRLFNQTQQSTSTSEETVPRCPIHNPFHGSDRSAH